MEDEQSELKPLTASTSSKDLAQKQTMAISLDNPQEPETVGDVPNRPLKKKPNRTLLFIRNRANASNVSAVVVGMILIGLTLHRLISIYMTHRRWINAPITYMPRECPAPEYETMPVDADVGKICITTLTDSKSKSRLQRFIRWRNFDGIIDLTWANKQKYAEKHDYFLYDGSGLINTSRPPAWTKVIAMQHMLEDERCDWVMWMDADTVIMNSDIRMESFFPMDPTKDMIVGSDNGWGWNSGVFVFRNTAWSKQFLDDWWNMKSFVRPPGMSLSGDNAALKALLHNMEDMDEHVLVPPRCTLNSFAKFLTASESIAALDSLDEQEWYMSENYYHSGDFIAHTPGYDNKEECLTLLLEEAS